ncbi:MerC domain-containing protein [Echinicola vietnamensis]|uniref:MerC mercury resistance protein n=1 Tax=Echinicola vietnamensis (strain DSM 17526 / LMG 23754 / KMM 6221) TaxID=926556 RepID=L0G0W5_ECHVK|nr:MerC domain-containing protein [Echinicola vietnamensis]AGA78943.1 MerC mercury resistance protein [Echinicola vietnamensis DSM 17526]
MKSILKDSPWDFLGISASLLCGIHCAALPFILVVTPLAGLKFLTDPWIEYSVLIVSLLLALGALSHGYRKHHRRPLPLVIAASGFLVIGIGHLIHDHHVHEISHIIVSVGACGVAVSHFINWKFIYGQS